MSEHKKGRCPLAKKCHCLVVDENDIKFYICCGYYHIDCGGRLDEWPRRTSRVGDRGNVPHEK